MLSNNLDGAKSVLLTIQEAAEFLNLKVSRMRTAVFKKEIPYIKLGRLVRFDPNDLIKWVEKQKEETKEDSSWLW